MKKAKFNVGDKVKLLDGSSIKNFAGGWTNGMTLEVGAVTKITSQSHHITNRESIGYRVEDSVFTWDERALAPVNETIVIYRKGQEVIATNKITGKKAIAKCSPVDEFKFEVGAKLAFDRLISIEKPKVFKIGDDVIANEKANSRYAITKEGWKGTVIEICDGGKRIKVKNGADTFWVESEYFDPDENQYYNSEVFCIRSNDPSFTFGKIYEIKDGKIIDDDGDVRPTSSRKFRSFDDFKDWARPLLFAEVIK